MKEVASIQRLLKTGGICLSAFIFYQASTKVLANNTQLVAIPVDACIIPPTFTLPKNERQKAEYCLGFKNSQDGICYGQYSPITIPKSSAPDAIHVEADEFSLYKDKQSKISGNVTISQQDRIMRAKTAYIFRNAKTGKVEHIELIGGVQYLEPDRVIYAKDALYYPDTQSGLLNQILYRFNSNNPNVLPAWGRAGQARRSIEKNYFLTKASYSTCRPQDRAWQIDANEIEIYPKEGKGIARHARLRIGDVPILYTPYLSFPTNKDRKSGFLAPIKGYSNVGGWDLALPYYLNLAPNYDATITPHWYSLRGVMMGGQFRYLTPSSSGVLNGNFLPNDKAFRQFIDNNEQQFPQLLGQSDNRYSFGLLHHTDFTEQLSFNANVHQVSDDYYLQDFSSNLAVITERQLLRQADVQWHNTHWLLKGMVQSYQTLQPINLSLVDPIYERLPQLSATGHYQQLPGNGRLRLYGEFDEFRWSSSIHQQRPEGPRLHLNPLYEVPMMRSYGYITPGIEFVNNSYQINNAYGWQNSGDVNRFIPRAHVDAGLFFDRNFNAFGDSWNQTLEPRIYYLYVPFVNQNQLPVYDSAWMIFTTDQLFRSNRFSGFDRIGDANQLSYALTSRLLYDDNGREILSLTVGQIRYFSQRRVELCNAEAFQCLNQNDTLGYLSPTEGYSPVASRAVFHLNQRWVMTGDYIWDPATNRTNNGHVSLNYTGENNRLLSLGYTYFVNGDRTEAITGKTNDNALSQARVAFAWPLSDRISTLGAYSYNISKGYEMMSFAGLQYDSCCFALRLLGGRSFQSFNQQLQPIYNNNVYLQILLKGLGAVGTSDPYSTISSFLPQYRDEFK